MRMQVPEFPKNLSEADIFSYQKLPEVSRSFAAVIAELPEELRRPVLPHPPGPKLRWFLHSLTITFLCTQQIANFCLVLRGLDTVEDDMSIPLEKKVLVPSSLPCH